MLKKGYEADLVQDVIKELERKGKDKARAA